VKKVRHRILLALGAALLVTTPTTAGDVGAALEALRALDARVATVGHRLATASAALCRTRQWQTGLLIHHLSQYGRGQRKMLTSVFGLQGVPAVLALAASGPAQRAGLRRDDEILTADGAPLPRPAPEVENSYAPTERILAALEAAFEDGAAELAVRRGGRSFTIRVPAEAGCASRFQVVPSERRAARADGHYVQLTSELVEYTQGDDELAALVAHELAHNVLRHRARLNVAGVDRGLLAPFGRNGRLFRKTELEADRLAVHLMARAGYDPGAAVRLWTRQSADDRRRIEGTHPDWSTRIMAMQSEIAAIDAAKAAGGSATPPLPDGPLDPSR